MEVIFYETTFDEVNYTVFLIPLSKFNDCSIAGDLFQPKSIPVFQRTIREISFNSRQFVPPLNPCYTGC